MWHLLNYLTTFLLKCILFYFIFIDIQGLLRNLHCRFLQITINNIICLNFNFKSWLKNHLFLKQSWYICFAILFLQLSNLYILALIFESTIHSKILFYVLSELIIVKISCVVLLCVDLFKKYFLSKSLWPKYIEYTLQIFFLCGPLHRIVYCTQQNLYILIIQPLFCLRSAFH